MLQSPLELLGVTPSASYRDTQFQFGHTYVYSVRSVGQFESEPVESADSKLLVVSPRDVFPPEPPQDLVAVVVPATAQAHARIELSWSISADPNIAGYNIYRSEAGGGGRQRLNNDLLLTPMFHDMSPIPGRSYIYTVTAVSRAGNESERSAAVSAAMPE
jgi:fibronectin type 3 domain-containing protein